MHALNKTIQPDKHHIIAIQEPWRNPKMATTVKPPNYHLIYPKHADTRVCFYVSKRLDVLKWDAEEHSPDLITLILHLKHQELHIHNCYNQPPKLATSHELGILQGLPAVLRKPGEHLLLGDFNLHHPIWGGVVVPTQHALADDLIEITQQANMQLILPQGTITWRRNNSQSTLDLAFATPWTTNCVQQCQPCDELDSDSNHVPIITTLLANTPTRPQQPLRPTWRRADWETVRTALQSRLDGLDLHTKPAENNHELDQKVCALQLAITETINETIPKGQPPK